MLKPIKLDTERQTGILGKLEAEVSLDYSFLGLAVLSAMIACLALLIEDVPILIGAMLIAPFLAPPLGIGMSIVKGDLSLFRKSISTLFFGIAVALVGAIIVALISPFDEIGQEVLSRTSPTLIQLLIAILAGLAGAFSFAHRRIRDVVAGAFIALALVPPISTIGIGIAFWNWQIIGGGSLLLIANIVGLIAAAVVIFFLLGFRPLDREENIADLKIGLIWLIILLLLVAFPLGYIMNQTLIKYHQEREIQQIVELKISRYPDASVEEISVHQIKDYLEVNLTIYSALKINPTVISQIQTEIENSLDKDIKIDAQVVSTEKVEF